MVRNTPKHIGDIWWKIYVEIYNVHLVGVMEKWLTLTYDTSTRLDQFKVEGSHKPPQHVWLLSAVYNPVTPASRRAMTPAGNKIYDTRNYECRYTVSSAQSFLTTSGAHRRTHRRKYMLAFVLGRSFSSKMGVSNK